MMNKTNLHIQILICLYLTILLMMSQSLAFKLINSDSKTHHDITRDAILKTTADVCEFIANQEGTYFVMPNPLTESSVAEACYSDSTFNFQVSIYAISASNAWIDVWHPGNGSYHFDDEMFLSGRQLITEGLFAIKESVKKQSFVAARVTLGKILHTLQDFYSHSNWIELEKSEPYSNLIKKDTLIDNIAVSETCSTCSTNVCTGNILEEVITQQKLTSGYFGFSKPKGKCSHGGLLDVSSWGNGGINKDDLSSSHGYLHKTAASVATAASRELLQDIRATVGDSMFIRLMGLSQSTVLCFVIDTTGSMSDDIDEVRRVTSSIVESRNGTAAEPSEYILVPFNDPEFGPLTRTTDPNVFKQKLNALTAEGGGDAPEMSLSGLQLALTGSPPHTEIFVFTDADAKDIQLKSTVKALIERTKSKVTFMLTNALNSRRRRRNAGPVDGQQHISTRLLNVANQIYEDLAQASGGQAIEVTKGTLSQATDIIAVTSRSTLVTLFQAVRNPGKAENFSLFVDSSVQNLTIYITGNSPTYTITSPSGVSQSSAELNGMLGNIRKVGNFHTVQPNLLNQTGLWLFNINSTQPFTIKVVGQSKVDFLFDFVVLSEGIHPSYAVLNSRPTASNNATLLVTIFGGDSVRLSEVSLVKASSSDSLNGILEEVASGQYLVTFSSLPAEEFTVRVVGQTSSSRSLDNTFQRQSPTQIQTSTVTITTQSDGTVEPGQQFTLPFTVASNGSWESFNININNDRDFPTVYNSTLTPVSAGSANGTVILTVPESTSSGTDVTVTIQAGVPDGSDSNYAVLRLAVIAPVTDFTSPVCEGVSVNANCSGNCSLSSWYVTANVTDGNGTGIQSVRILQGTGALQTTTVLSDTGVNVTTVIYNSSCCSTDLELVAVDAVGNVATCFKSVKATSISATTPVMETNTTNTTILPPTTTTNQTSTNSAECWLFSPFLVWLHVGVLLYQIMQL